MRLNWTNIVCTDLKMGKTAWKSTDDEVKEYSDIA